MVASLGFLASEPYRRHSPQNRRQLCKTSQRAQRNKRVTDVSNDKITKRSGYRPSLVVMIAGLAMVVGIALKSNMREQRIASMTPGSLVIQVQGGL